MPYAVTISAAAVAEPLRSFTGEHLQAGFLSLVRELAPSLAAELHDADGLKPYAVTMLDPRFGAGDGRPRREITLRVACLDDRVYPVLLETALKPDGRAAFRLGSNDFHIARLETTSDRPDAWVGYADFDELRLRAEAAASERTIKLEFATPTVFSQGERGDIPLPMPEFVFGGLARRWNAVPDVPFRFPDGFQEAVETGVLVSRFKGEAVTVEIGSKLKKTGFVGRVTFHVREPELVPWCQLAVETGFFSGLGAKTSCGLGCLRKIRN